MANSQVPLSFSPSPTKSSFPVGKSSTRSPQLPLPFSDFSATPVRDLQKSSAARARSSSTDARTHGQGLHLHTRSTSSVAPNKGLTSTGMDHARDQPTSSPPAVTSFQTPFITNATHAGGILPSASFFHPSRPSERSSSAQSGYNTEEHSRSHDSFSPPDHYPLTQLARLNSHEESFIGSDGVQSSPGPDTSQHLSKRFKHSREPLLPIGGRPLTASSSAPMRPSIHRSTSQRSTSGNARFRGSFERVFRHGKSIDSQRRSATSPVLALQRPSISTDALHDLEMDKPMDDLYPMRMSSRNPSPSSSRPEDRRSMLSPSPSSRITFQPVPPSYKYPLSETPISPVKRIYQIYPSRNRFLLGGRLLSGGDSPWAFVASIFTVFGISGVWLGTTSVWWWHNESPAVAIVGAYMCALTISNMFATAFRDPGILPRGLDPDPPMPSTSPSDGGVRLPFPRDLKVRNDTVRVKYCGTCKTYRPPRSSHCRMCDNCIDGCDHHCQWLNNCVGRRNYTFFFACLMSAFLSLCLIICTSALHLYLLTRRDHLDFRAALGHGVGSAVVFCFSVIMFWPVAALFAYHVRLLVLNLTTIEQIRNQAHRSVVSGPAPPNPFTFGSWRNNFAHVLCRPAGFSWLDARGLVTEDKRRMNPGLDDVGMRWEANQNDHTRGSELV